MYSHLNCYSPVTDEVSVITASDGWECGELGRNRGEWFIELVAVSQWSCNIIKDKAHAEVSCRMRSWMPNLARQMVSAAGTALGAGQLSSPRYAPQPLNSHAIS